MVGMWHIAHPTCLKYPSPDVTVSLMGPRGGAFVERMKFANATTSTPSSSGSATVSYRRTSCPLEEFSSGKIGVVIPISLR